MILCIASPKGGVGSSSFAVLLAREWASAAPVVLIDAAADPSVDLYTATEQLLTVPYQGDLAASRLDLDEPAGLSLVRIETADLMKAALPDEDCIIDLGVPGQAALDFLKARDARLILVLTQDNAVLRAADKLLGRCRDEGIRCGFVIDQLEDREPSELADLDEIFGLLEEDFYGPVSLDHDLRILFNQGRFLQAPEPIREQVRVIAASLQAGEEADGEGEAAAEDEAGAGAAAAAEVAQPVPDGVLSRIRRFFQNFGKGN